jgi:hypothetical protein
MLRQGICDPGQAPRIRDASKAVALLGEPDPRGTRRRCGVLVAVEDHLRGKRRVPRHLDRHMTPLRVHDVEAVVIDERPLLRDVADDAAGLRSADLPHARRRLRHQDHEHARAHGVGGQVLPGDQVLTLPGLAVDDRDAVRASPRPDPAGEPPGHPHQVRVIQIIVGAAVQPPPPEPEPGRIMPQREIGIQHDPVHAVIRAGQQVPVTLGEVISHTPAVGKRPRITPARLPRRGHSFRAKSRAERGGLRNLST